MMRIPRGYFEILTSDGKMRYRRSFGEMAVVMGWVLAGTVAWFPGMLVALFLGADLLEYVKWVCILCGIWAGFGLWRWIRDNKTIAEYANSLFKGIPPEERRPRTVIFFSPKDSTFVYCRSKEEMKVGRRILDTLPVPKSWQGKE